MIVNYDQPLVGASAFVTATPYCAIPPVPGPPFFLDTEDIAVGDTVVICEPPDQYQNVVVYSPRGRTTLRAHGSCLTLLPSAPPPQHRDVDYIDRDIAAHVLFVFSGTGYRAGGFISDLIDAIVVADQINQARLAWGFPGYVAAVKLAKENPIGIQYLQARMRGEDHITQQYEKVGAV